MYVACACVVPSHKQCEYALMVGDLCACCNSIRRHTCTDILRLTHASAANTSHPTTLHLILILGIVVCLHHFCICTFQNRIFEERTSASRRFHNLIDLLSQSSSGRLVSFGLGSSLSERQRFVSMRGRLKPCINSRRDALFLDKCLDPSLCPGTFNQ